MSKSSEELLLEITWRDSETEMKRAEQALNEFLKEFGNYCKHLVASYTGHNQNRYQDMYRLFILDIWNNAHLYDDTRLADAPEDRRIKMWLGYRMKVVIRDYWLELTKDKTALSLDELTANTFQPAIEDDEIIGDEDINAKKLRMAMIEGKILTDRELDIITTTYNFNGEIPPEIRNAICKEYGISDPTIRTIRFRALKKVRNFIREKSVII